MSHHKIIKSVKVNTFFGILQNLVQLKCSINAKRSCDRSVVRIRIPTVSQITNHKQQLQHSKIF